MVRRESKEKPEESNLSTLLTLLGIFSGVWIGLLKILHILIQRNSELVSESTGLLSWIVLIFSYHIFSYLLSIIKAVYYETSLSHWYEVNLTKLNAKKKECYRTVIGDWAINLFMVVPTLLLVVYGRTLGKWGYAISFVLTIILFLEWFFLTVNHLLKKNHTVTNWQTFKRLFGNALKAESMKQIPKRSMIGALALIFYCLTIVALTSGIDVTFDQERYAVYQTPVVQITPYGLIPPQIIYVFYSNTNEVIYNGTEEPFKASLRIIQIPQNMLTDRNYNSHINIITSYVYINGKSYLGERYLARVPVYTPLTSNSTEMNVTIDVPEAISMQEAEQNVSSE